MAKACWIFPLLAALLLTGCAEAKPKVDESKVVEGHLGMAYSYLSQDKPSEALQELIPAETMAPNNPDVLAALAQAYEMKKAYDMAEKSYLRAIALRPNDPYLYNNLGALYVKTKSWDKAASSFRHAAVDLTFSQQEVAYTGMGYAFQMQGQCDKAIAAYRQAIRLAPKYALAYLRLGECLLATDHNEEAVTNLTKATELVPKFTLAWYRLGLAQAALQHPQEAAKAFRKAVELAPGSEAARLATEQLKTLE